MLAVKRVLQFKVKAELQEIIGGRVVPVQVLPFRIQHHATWLAFVDDNIRNNFAAATGGWFPKTFGRLGRKPDFVSRGTEVFCKS